MSVKIIEKLYSNVNTKSNHIPLDVNDLSKLNKVGNFFEVVDGNEPNRVYIDLDGEMNRDDDMDQKAFNKLDQRIIERFKTIENISLMSSSHHKAIDPNKPNKTKCKLSYRILYTKEYCEDAKTMKEIVMNEKFPILQKLLDNVIDLERENDHTDCLIVDPTVYQMGLGKMRCANKFQAPRTKITH